jgi:hypothetical protein
MPEILGLTGAAAAEASVLAHRFDECLLDIFRLELRRAVDEERRIHRGAEAVLEELRRRVLQQRAGVDNWRVNGIIVEVVGPYVIGKLRECGGRDE